MPELEPVDESYFDLAPQRSSRSWSIGTAAEAVWAELVSDQPLHWIRGLRLAWTSPRPFGVGTTRRGKVMGGLAVVDERFFIWEEGRRHAFFVTRSNLPSYASFAEDYLVEPGASNDCRFTWRIAWTPRPLGRGPLNKRLFDYAFRATGRYFNAE